MLSRSQNALRIDKWVSGSNNRFTIASQRLHATGFCRSFTIVLAYREDDKGRWTLISFYLGIGTGFSDLTTAFQLLLGDEDRHFQRYLCAALLRLNPLICNRLPTDFQWTPARIQFPRTVSIQKRQPTLSCKLPFYCLAPRRGLEPRT